MRIYCDSNVFRKVKKTSKQFNQAVYNALESLKDHFIFVFSEAHLSDLTKSQEDYRKEDLVLMERYVKNNYFCRDHIKKEVQILLATPTQAYDSKDFAAADEFLENPYDSMNKMFDFEGGEEYGKLFKTMFDMPIFPDNDLNIENVPPEHRELLEQFKGVRTINDALKKLQGVGQMLDSDSVFKKHKNLLSAYVDRSTYSYDEWEFEFDEKMKDTAFGKSFSEMVDLTMVESDRKDEYTSFINTYIQLEFLGVTEERTGKKNKLKKNSHLDLNKDAAHAFFASKADYFVTDDIGVQTKAFIVYKLFNIQTKVLSTQDFIARSMLLLKNEDTTASFYGGLSFSLKKGFMINQSLLDQRQLIKLLYPVFNYYNRMQVNQNKRGQSIQLFKSYEISYGIMFAEIALLISKCERVFGRAIGLKDEKKLSEFKEYEDGEFIRTWKHNGLDITLSWEKNTLGQSIIVLTMWF